MFALRGRTLHCTFVGETGLPGFPTNLLCANNYGIYCKSLRFTSASVVAAANEKLPPSRQGKRCLTGWFNPETHQQVRMIAAKEDKTYEQVLGDGLNLLFEKHGMPPIA